MHNKSLNSLLPALAPRTPHSSIILVNHSSAAGAVVGSGNDEEIDSLGAVVVPTSPSDVIWSPVATRPAGFNPKMTGLILTVPALTLSAPLKLGTDPQSGMLLEPAGLKSKRHEDNIRGAS